MALEGVLNVPVYCKYQIAVRMSKKKTLAKVHDFLFQDETPQKKRKVCKNIYFCQKHSVYSRKKKPCIYY